MRAIRVRKRAKTGGYTVHWLLDPERTFCGRKLAELDVAEELDLETLPPLEACHGCKRFADGWRPQPKTRNDELKITLPPAAGTLRKTGPLSHGSRRRSGRRLG
jgi:hypothetical protein